jgi:tRNA G18 (ribose-2'-O)-methylase SpoU
MKGYFGVGIYHNKYDDNLGMLFRTAHAVGASFVFTIGTRYHKPATDTPKSWKNIPLYQYADFADFKHSVPLGAEVVAIEMDDDSILLKEFQHPKQAVYLLGAEDYGLTQDILDKCDHVVRLDTKFSLNVAVCGSIVLYDRISKLG